MIVNVVRVEWPREKKPTRTHSRYPIIACL